MRTYRGKISTFGGPHDTGVSAGEGLALVSTSDLSNWWFRHLFLPKQPEGTTGLARRLDPNAYYIAMRWSYSGGDPSKYGESIDLVLPKEVIRRMLVRVEANNRIAFARPVDWGPNERTGRIADLSPGLASYLDVATDDSVSITIDPSLYV